MDTDVSVSLTTLQKPILLCLSHLRWNFVFQRPQHLLARASRDYLVVFVEEPVEVAGGGTPGLVTQHVAPDVIVAVPHIRPGMTPEETNAVQRTMLDDLLAQFHAPPSVIWYYTPMALPFAGHLEAEVRVFDSMDELSAFRGAPRQLAALETQLLRQVDLVFAAGRSLFAAKRQRHPHVRMFPSSVEVSHFEAARGLGHATMQPADQADLPGPRVGYFGVIDERLDYALIDAVAGLRPDWQFIMIGPVVKVAEEDLPRRANLHWLGMKSYTDLPAYLGGWNAGLMPFAMNDATRFISPTKTPEFLAAGVPVVSTPIADVVADWGNEGLVEIADTPEGIVAALERILGGPRPNWLARVDQRLETMSWDATWSSMLRLIDGRRDATRAAPGYVAAPAAAKLEWDTSPLLHIAPIGFEPA